MLLFLGRCSRNYRKNFYIIFVNMTIFNNTYTDSNKPIFKAGGVIKNCNILNQLSQKRENILSRADRMLLLFNQTSDGNIDTVKNGILRLWYNLCWGKNV